MRVAIVGSRSADESAYALLEEAVPVGCSEIISGGSHGADALARRFALENKLKLTEHLPDYKRFGKMAPLRRNECIVDASDYVIALWDGASKGTSFVIDQCLKKEKPVKVLLL